MEIPDSEQGGSAAELYGSPMRAGIRARRHAEQLASEFDLLHCGPWVYSVVDAARDEVEKAHPSFSPGYRSWAPVQDSGLVHDSRETGLHAHTTPASVTTPASGPLPFPERYLIIVAYQGTQRWVEVPESIGGLPVCALHNKVFANNRSLVSLAMPDSVLSLGLKTFAGCSKLETVVLSDSIRFLDPMTFSGCNSLRQLHLPARLERIERKLLSSCPIRVLRIPESVSEVAEQAISEHALERIEVAEGNRAFATDGMALYSADSSKLIKLYVGCDAYEIGTACTEICDSAFKSHSELSSIVLGPNVGRIGAYAFFGTGLARIEFAPSLRDIGNRAFFSCDKLVEARFSEGLEKVGEHAFAKSSLTRVHLPASLVSLGRGAFEGTRIEFGPDGAFRIDPRNEHLATDGLGIYEKSSAGTTLRSMLKRVEEYRVADGCTALADNVFANDATIRRVLLPQGLERIGAHCFANCRGIAELDLPQTLRSLGDCALAGTSIAHVELGASLAKLGEGALAVHVDHDNASPRLPLTVSVASDNPEFSLVDGFLCKGAPDALDCVLLADSAHAAATPAQAISIGAYAFNGAVLHSLQVGRNIKNVHPKAFQNMRRLDKTFVAVPRQTSAPASVCVEFPHDSTAAEGAACSMALDDDGEFFRFEDYDAWVIQYWLLNKRDCATVARMILARLDDPVKLSGKMRAQFDTAMRAILFNVFRHYTRTRDFAGFERLDRHGFIDLDVLDEMLEDTQRRQETEATGYLLDMKNRNYGIREEDFSL